MNVIGCTFFSSPGLQQGMRISRQSSRLGVALLLAVAALDSLAATEPVVSCRLKGGSLVTLPAATCAMEGGTSVVPAASSPVVAPALAVQFADEPKLAAAQRSIVELLNKPLAGPAADKRSPEGIERAARFEGCRLLVDESMHIDYGNLLSARMNFKISSAIELGNISRDAFGILGKVASLGGKLKAHAVYFEEPKRKSGNSIAVSVLEQREDGDRRFTVPGLAAYWDAPRDELWMADGYGYPKDSNLGHVASDRIRLLFIVDTAEAAAKLKASLDEIHTLCKP